MRHGPDVAARVEPERFAATAAAHICVTLRHASPYRDRFVADLRRRSRPCGPLPGAEGAMAPIYGMTGAVKARGTVEELLGRYGDLQFQGVSSPRVGFSRATKCAQSCEPDPSR